MADRLTLIKFWMVMGMDHGPPRYQHLTKALAQQEAQRLAALSPGSTFVVLAAVDAYRSERPNVDKLAVLKSTELDDGIPF